MTRTKRILIRGGGDLASGVAAVMHRAGWQVVICELPEPLVVRRKVAFAEAVWEGNVQVEEIEGVLVDDLNDLENILESRKVAVLVDPEMKVLETLNFDCVVDARMLKRFEANSLDGKVPLIGLGPGFVAGVNCNAVIETNRGPELGKVIWDGVAEADTGKPGIVEGRGLERVLYSEGNGKLFTYSEIGDFVSEGQVIAEVEGRAVRAPFDGVLRGMARPGLVVKEGVKIGDVEPRMDVNLCYQISDKALIVGDAVLEALNQILSE